MMSRTDERTKLMQSLYQVVLCLDTDQSADSTMIITSIFGVDRYDEIPAFSQLVYAVAMEHYDEIVKVISDNLQGWTYKRLNNLSKAILILYIAEGNYTDLTPKIVLINEAVKMAKNYLNSNDYKFVNAILDKVLKDDK